MTMTAGTSVFVVALAFVAPARSEELHKVSPAVAAADTAVAHPTDGTLSNLVLSPISDPWGFLSGAPLAPIRIPAAAGAEDQQKPAPVSSLWAGVKDPAGTPADAPRAAAKPAEDKERARRDPLGALSDRDKKILADAAERIAQKIVPWLDFKLLRKLEIFQMLRFQNAEVKWNVIQKPGRSLLETGQHGSPIILQGRTSLQLVRKHWNLSWQVDHPLDGRPHMEMKSQIWSLERFHADVGYGFSTNDRLRDVLQDGAFATFGMKLGIYGVDYSYRGQNQQHLLSLATLF